jgi:hypothetical protein
MAKVTSKYHFSVPKTAVQNRDEFHGAEASKGENLYDKPRPSDRFPVWSVIAARLGRSAAFADEVGNQVPLGERLVACFCCWLPRAPGWLLKATKMVRRSNPATGSETTPSATTGTRETPDPFGESVFDGREVRGHEPLQ